MKQKLFILVTLVLLAVQGWAMPVDSLRINLTGQDSIMHWNGFEHFDNLVPFDGFDSPGDTANIDDNHRGVVFAAVAAIADLVKNMAPIVNIFEVDESNPFNDVTVGTSVSKKFEIWGHNVFSTAEAIRTSDKVLRRIRRQFGIPVTPEIFSYKIRLCLTQLPVDLTTGTNLDGLLGAAMFSLDNTSIRPSDIDVDEGADRKTLTVTYNPTLAGTHKFRFVAMYEFYIDGVFMPDLLTLVPIVNTTGLIEYTGTAVERTITVDPILWDFGTVEIGQKPPKTFTVTGTNLTGDLTLASNSSFFKVSPSTLPASGGTVMVTYEPTAIGSHNATLTISGGGALEPKYVDLNGSAVNPAPPVLTVDKKSLNFGSVLKGENPTQKIVVTGTNLTSNLNLSISGATGMFTVQPYTISPADAAGGKTVVVTYKPTAAGNHNATLIIAGGGVDTTKINLTGRCVEPSLTASTTSLDLGSVYVGGTPGTATFTITGVNLSEAITLVQPWSETIGGEFSISPTTLPKTGGTVTVTYTPSGAHTSGAAFKFKSGNLVVNVSVTAKGLAIPKITVNATSLDFGTVAKNSTNTKKFTVKGYDLNGNLTVSPSSSSYFTVSPTTITAAQAMSTNGVEVTVTYKPTATGNHSATFTISGNGATSKTVSVSGKCASLTASTTSLDMETTYVGTPKTATFTITGVNLSEAITLVQPWSETLGGEFSISPTTLPKTGGTVTVTYTPSGAHTSGAAFKFKSGNFIVNIAVTAKGISTPKITTSVSSLHFSAAVSKTFKVTGTNLTGSLTVKSSNSKFTVSPSTISASDAAVGKTVTVTYHDTNGATNASGTITITGGGASSKTVSVTYAKGQDTQINPVYPEDESEDNSEEDDVDEYMNQATQDVFGNSTTEVSELAMNLRIYSEGMSIIIESAVEQRAMISDIAGRVREVNLMSGRNEIPVNASGIYIVRIKEKTTKLMVK